VIGRSVARAAGAIAVLAAALTAFSQDAPPGFEFLKRVFAVAATPWTDSGIDVKEGEEFYFQAAGTVSLQKDNPVAGCGPAGLNLRTMRQPLTDRNLGALIGRIREKVEVIEDKQTKEKFTKEYGEAFYIGPEGWLTAMVAGRLQLGVNDNLAEDNDGGFEVRIYMKRSGRQRSLSAFPSSVSRWISPRSSGRGTSPGTGCCTPP
jgi:hypothetical protein